MDVVIQKFPLLVLRAHLVREATAVIASAIADMPVEADTVVGADSEAGEVHFQAPTGTKLVVVGHEVASDIKAGEGLMTVARRRVDTMAALLRMHRLMLPQDRGGEEAVAAIVVIREIGGWAMTETDRLEIEGLARRGTGIAAQTEMRIAAVDDTAVTKIGGTTALAGNAIMRILGTVVTDNAEGIDTSFVTT